MSDELKPPASSSIPSSTPSSIPSSIAPKPEPEATGETLLRLENVAYHYGSGRRAAPVDSVLSGVNLELYRGDKLGILGRNGAGKTTLLRLMAGILAPSAGSVVRSPGVSISLLSLGLGFRNDLSGRDNARLSAMLQGLSREEAETSLEQIHEFSGLGPAFENAVKTYSVGMRARLGFSTALLNHVDILLIDEVLAVGDREFRQQAREAIQARFSESRTVVLVSHSVQQLRQLCDRFMVIDAGSSRDCGAFIPKELLESPEPE